MCTASGHLFTADWRGGVAVTHPQGGSTLIIPDGDPWLKPNGIALMPDGTFLVTHLGETEGGVYRMESSGVVSDFLLEVEGQPLPPTNYVHLDTNGRVWITVSTRQIPRQKAQHPNHADGFIVLVDSRGARVVADELGYTNECLVAPSGEWLYVNETFTRKTTRFRIDAKGALYGKETVLEYGTGEFPDGLTFDEHGNLWICCIISNRVLCVTPEGQREVLLEDYDADGVAVIEAAYQAGELDAGSFSNIRPKVLRNISSLAFGGTDRRTAFLGCLQDDRIASFSAPVAGAQPTHWNYRPEWYGVND